MELSIDTNKILDIANEAFLIEIQEIERVRASLNKSFVIALEKILNTKGKLIVVGIGKTAHVANKIVATMNSTGTVSQFLHASEAIHGDLGIIEKNDVVLCISNSGNSSEIVNLAPLLKSYSSCLIAMTGNAKSHLAQLSDIVISSKIEQEACPNQLAPTSSTTVQMVLGDALAVCLMKLRNFGDNDFAKFHPGGSLGKNLLSTVGQFISNNRPEVNKTTSINDIIISISSSKHGISVVTDSGKILGVITDGDLRRMLIKNKDISGIVAEDIMSKNPKTIEKSALAKDAMAILKSNNIGQLVVTDDGKYSGIIDIHKLLYEGIV